MDEEDDDSNDSRAIFNGEKGIWRRAKYERIPFDRSRSAEDAFDDIWKQDVGIGQKKPQVLVHFY